jgi:hypothetical protein
MGHSRRQQRPRSPERPHAPPQPPPPAQRTHRGLRPESATLGARARRVVGDDDEEQRRENPASASDHRGATGHACPHRTQDGAKDAYTSREAFRDPTCTRCPTSRIQIADTSRQAVTPLHARHRTEDHRRHETRHRRSRWGGDAGAAAFAEAIPRSAPPSPERGRPRPRNPVDIARERRRPRAGYVMKIGESRTADLWSAYGIRETRDSAGVWRRRPMRTGR